MKRNSLFKLSLLVFLMSITLCACKGGKVEEKEQGTSATDDNMSSKEPTYGGSVVVGISQDLDSLDPHKAVAAGTKEVLFNVFEGLVKPDEKGNLVPAVASEYEISEDGKTYTFQLREGITFHNGELVTAEDVIYSVKRSAGLLETTDPSVIVETALANVSGVNMLDQSTVEITLKEADTELIGYLTLAIIPANYEKQASSPVGTGPFKFVSYAPLESFVVEKNTNYWEDKAPYLDKVTFRIVANTDTAFMELKAGSMDIFPYLTNDQAMQLAEDFQIEEGNMNLVQGLFLNNEVEPFQNQKVREAMNYAVDKQGILDMVAGGKGSIIGSNMFPGFGKYYVEELKDMYAYNVDKAKELLTEAGYADGFAFTITVPSNYQFHVDTAQVIVEQLKAVGITAKIQTVEWASWLSEVYTNRNYEATIIGLDSKLAARDTLERYNSTADNNFVNYKNTEFDAVFTNAQKTTKDAEKIAYYQELQKILAQDSASIYIQDPSLLVAVNKKLGGYTFYPVYVQDMAKVYFTEQMK